MGAIRNQWTTGTAAVQLLYWWPPPSHLQGCEETLRRLEESTLGWPAQPCWTCPGTSARRSPLPPRKRGKVERRNLTPVMEAMRAGAVAARQQQEPADSVSSVVPPTVEPATAPRDRVEQPQPQDQSRPASRHQRETLFADRNHTPTLLLILISLCQLQQGQ